MVAGRELFMDLRENSNYGWYLCSSYAISSISILLYRSLLYSMEIIYVFRINLFLKILI